MFHRQPTIVQRLSTIVVIKLLLLLLLPQKNISTKSNSVRGSVTAKYCFYVVIILLECAITTLEPSRRGIFKEKFTRHPTVSIGRDRTFDFPTSLVVRTGATS